MQSLIQSNKYAYYLALHNTQKTVLSNKVNYEPWLTFFITSLAKQKRVLEDKIEKLQQVNDDKLSSTAQSILSLFNSNEPLPMSKIIETIGKNSETVRKSVQSLVKKGYLRKLGSTNGAVYVRV